MDAHLDDDWDPAVHRLLHLVALGAVPRAQVTDRVRVLARPGRIGLHLDPDCAVVDPGALTRTPDVRLLERAASGRNPAHGPVLDPCDWCAGTRDTSALHRLLPDPALRQPGVDALVSWSARAAGVLTGRYPTRSRGDVRAGAARLLLAQHALLDHHLTGSPVLDRVHAAVADQHRQLTGQVAHLPWWRRPQAAARATDPERVWVAFGGPVFGPAADLWLGRRQLLAALGDAATTPVPVLVAGTGIYLARIRSTWYDRFTDEGHSAVWVSVVSVHDAPAADLATALQVLGAVPGANPLSRIPVLDVDEVTGLARALTAARL